MKVETLKLDGKKGSIEVTDKVFSAKINNKLVSISVKWFLYTNEFCNDVAEKLGFIDFWVLIKICIMFESDLKNGPPLPKWWSSQLSKSTADQLIF